jgi:hypothetical protein
VARRSILVTLSVAFAAAWTASAQAATAPSAPQLTSAPYVSPAVLAWTPGADPLNVSQTVYRAAGACTDPPATPTAVRTYDDNTTSQYSTAPGDGTWCFSIGATDLAGGTAVGPGLTVSIDTTPPTATIAVSGQVAGVVKGTVHVSGTSGDDVSGVASSVLRVGPVGACATGTVVHAKWTTTRYTDGPYDVCNIVTDRAGYTTTAVTTVTVANASALPVPVPSPVAAPAPVSAGAAAAAAAPPLATPPAASVPATAVDRQAPTSPTGLTVIQQRTKRHSSLIPLKLQWVEPRAPDLARVVVILNLKRAPRSATDGTLVYSGLRSSTTFTLKVGKSAHLALYAYDRSGNVSRPARRTVSLASLIPLRPISGSRVTAAPRLTWKGVAGTAYYNVQIFRNGKRIVVGWPQAAAYRLPGHLLEPGVYTWFVWPAIKHAGAAPTFGPLIGRATFVYGS